MEVTAYSRLDSSLTWHGYIDTVNTGTTEEENNNNNYYYDGDSGESSSKYSFYVTLDDSEGLLIGQHVYIKMGAPAEDDNSIRLPSGYLVMDGDKASVWVANSKDKLELRTVTLGEYDEELDEYMITDGLTLEDYIAYPEEELKAGMSVVRYDEDSFGGDEGDGDFYADGEEADSEGGEFGPEEGELGPDGNMEG